MRRGLYRHGRQWGRNPIDYENRLVSVATYQEIVDLCAGELDGLLPAFGWKVGDGNAPSHWLGAANTADRLSVTGTPTPGTTPYQDRAGNAIASEVYDGSSRRRQTAVAVDPAAGEDVIAIAVAIAREGMNNGKIFSTHDESSRDPGLSIEYFEGAIYAAIAGTSRLLLNTSIAFSSFFVAVTVVDGDGQSRLFLNGSMLDSGATPAGALGEATGLVIGGADVNDDAILSWTGEIENCGVWYGSGIADIFNADSAALVKEISHRLMGTYPRAGDTPDFTRNSAAAWLSGRDGDSGRIWAIASADMPRVGDDGGLRQDPPRTNKVYNTINPSVTTGYTVTGGTHTADVDDSTALAAADPDCSAWGASVHRFVPGGGDEQICGGAATANTNAHSLSVFMRGDAGGESVDLCLRDASDGSLTAGVTCTLTTAWQRFTVADVTPGATDEQWCLDVDAGDTIYFVGGQLEEGATVSDPIPNWATAAAAARPAEVLDTGESLSDTQGSISARVTPRGWGGTEPGADVQILTRDTTDGDILLADGSTAGYLTGDGTNEAQANTTTPADGVERTVRTRWSGSQMSIDVDGDRDSADYDGALDGAGDLQVEAAGASFAIRDLRIYRKGT